MLLIVAFSAAADTAAGTVVDRDAADVALAAAAGAMRSMTLPLMEPKMGIRSHVIGQSLTDMTEKRVMRAEMGMSRAAGEKVSADFSDDFSADEKADDAAAQRAVSPVLTVMPVVMTVRWQTAATRRRNHVLVSDVSPETAAERADRKTGVIGDLLVAEDRPAVAAVADGVDGDPGKNLLTASRKANRYVPESFL
jgi:hypothetical protein